MHCAARASCISTSLLRHLGGVSKPQLDYSRARDGISDCQLCVSFCAWCAVEASALRPAGLFASSWRLPCGEEALGWMAPSPSTATSPYVGAMAVAQYWYTEGADKLSCHRDEASRGGRLTARYECSRRPILWTCQTTRSTGSRPQFLPRS